MRSDSTFATPHGLHLSNERLRTVVYPFCERVFERLFLIFIVLTIVLPSGSIYGLNLKSPLYVVLLPLALFSFFYRAEATAEKVALLGIVPTILSAWILIGLLHGFPFSSAMRQYLDVVLVLLLCWLAAIFCGNDLSRQRRFIRVVLYSEVATGVLKIAILGYAVLRGIPTVEIMLDLSHVFGVNLMTLDLGAMFGRIQFVSDALIPICLFIALSKRNWLRIGNLLSALIVLVLLTSVIFSFSRYFWAFSCVTFVLGLLTGAQERFRIVLITLLAVVVLSSLPALTSLYDLRFSSDVAGNSDRIRTEQVKALDDFFEDAPYLGHGFGSYTPQVVREEQTDEGNRYGYEVQLFALAGQIGLTGLAFLAVLAAYYFSDLWWRPRARLRERFPIVVMLLFWLTAGLYNPLLFHPIAGILYASLATLSTISEESAAQL